MTIPELLRRILAGMNKTIPKLMAAWPFATSMKTLYSRAENTNPTFSPSCDLEILRCAFHNGLPAEAVGIIAGSDYVLSPYLRATLLFPDISFGEITAIADILRISPKLVLADEAIRKIVLRRRKEARSSTFPGAS